MVKVGENAEIERYSDGYKLHIFRDKQPTKQNPDPTGKIRNTTYHSTFEQAAIKAFDMALSGDASNLKQVLDSITLAKQTIVKAVKGGKGE